MNPINPPLAAVPDFVPDFVPDDVADLPDEIPQQAPAPTPTTGDQILSLGALTGDLFRIHKMRHEHGVKLIELWLNYELGRMSIAAQARQQFPAELLNQGAE